MSGIQTLDDLPRQGLDRLPHGRYAVATGASAPDAIRARPAAMRGPAVPASLPAGAPAGAGVDIARRHEASRGESACRPVDLESSVPGTVVREVAPIEGMPSVRVV